MCDSDRQHHHLLGKQLLRQVDAPAGTYKTVTAGSEHSCAIATDNTITCWGNNDYERADAPAGTYKTVTAGRWHSCAIATDNTITCWGNNDYRQADAPAGTYKTVTAGSWHSCAIATDNTITCWGTNDYRQADAPAGTYKTVTAGGVHSCAIATDNTITCWGPVPSPEGCVGSAAPVRRARRYCRHRGPSSRSPRRCPSPPSPCRVRRFAAPPPEARWPKPLLPWPAPRPRPTGNPSSGKSATPVSSLGTPRSTKLTARTQGTRPAQAQVGLLVAMSMMGRRSPRVVSGTHTLYVVARLQRGSVGVGCSPRARTPTPTNTPTTR